MLGFIRSFFCKILTLCMISIQERFQIKSGLQWHRYGSPELAQALDFFLDPMSLLKALYVYQFQNLCHWYGHFLVLCLFLFSRPYLCSRPYVFFVKFSLPYVYSGLQSKQASMGFVFYLLHLNFNRSALSLFF